MKKIILIPIIISVSLMIFGINMGFAAMLNYCQTTPYITAPVKPNILMVLDYSGSMTWSAYMPESSCETCAAYNSSRTYFGYFKNDKYYQYVTGNKFDVNTSCTNTDKIGSSETCVSGNLLNWATSSRIDVIRMVLTGGRTSAGAGDTIESGGGSDFNYTDTGLHCIISIINGSSQKDQTVRFTNESGHTCPVGNWSAAKEIDITLDTSFHTGLIQELWNDISFEIMVFKDGSGADKKDGEILVSKGSTLAATVAAVTNETATGGTTTGEALWEAYDYYKQSDDHSYEANTNDIKPTNGDKDPYYDGTGAGSSTAVPCRKGYVLLVTDGGWNGAVDPVIPARVLNTTDLRTDLAGNQYVKTYVTYIFGYNADTTNAMKTVAIFGGFDDSTGTNTNTWPYPFTGYTTGLTTTCSSSTNGNTEKKSNITDVDSHTWCNSLDKLLTYPLTRCTIGSSPNTLCSEWDKNANGVPYNFFTATEGAGIADAIRYAIKDILMRTASGSAASLLSSAQGSGANLLQALYYPKKVFATNEIRWIGMLLNLWYYIDPNLNNSTIREDSNQGAAATVDNNDKYILNLEKDYIINFRFDTGKSATIADLYYDQNADGTANAFVSTKNIEDLSYLWEAGDVLWQRNLTTSPRSIFVNLDTTTALTSAHNQFVTSNSLLTTTNLNLVSGNLSVTEPTVAQVINYITGIDITGYRNRTVTINGSTNVWKLGDILNSTPRFVSWVPINNYAKAQTLGYGDTTYTDFTKLSTYTSRGMAFAGGNDGMLHAFNMGQISYSGAWLTDKTKMMAKLVPQTGATIADFGKEMWAFIPYNVLPYLQYLMDPTYCHLYYVDGTPYVFDASIYDDTTVTGGQPAECGSTTNYWNCIKTKKSWKTILIGSMRFGGACRNSTGTCNDSSHVNCVKTPAADIGYSSYFALDITDPTTPILLWEYPYANQTVGFTTSGPVVIRISAKKTAAEAGITGTAATAYDALPDENKTINNAKNGRWFVVFGSGPTGKIDTTNNQFMGKSDQSLKLFIMDIILGPNGGVTTIDTGIANAFAGSMINSSIDIVEKSSNQMDYTDEAFYLGYITTTDNTNWTSGGVLRVLTKKDLNPANWIWSTVMSSIGPVTSGIAHLQDVTNGKLWLYFGEGRLYYKSSSGVDDQSNQRKIYGIIEPCFDSTTITFNSTCKTAQGAGSTVTLGTLGQLDLTSSTSTGNANGWYAVLSAAGSTTGAERVITDPLAAYTGSVYFTTFVPSIDPCLFGGSSYLWALKYNSGVSVALQQKGKALMQESTGAVQNIDLSTAFTANGNRTSAAIIGMPPTGQGLTIISPPLPIQKILHKVKK